MQQRSFFVTDIDELNAVIGEISQSAEYKSANDRLLIIYSNFCEMEEVSDYVSAIKQSLPEIKIAGISVFTSTDSLNKRGLSLSFCLFQDSAAHIFEYKYSEYNEDAVIENFARELGSIEDAKAVIFFPGNAYRDTTKVLEKITGIHKEICFFGAVAVSGKEGLDKKGGQVDIDEAFEFARGNVYASPFYISDDVENDGFLFVVLSGKRLRLIAQYILGWHPLGKDMYVTGRHNDIIGNARITSIDDRPAIEIYKKYLGVEPDAFFMSNVCDFPITTNRNGAIIARVPIAYSDDGELQFNGDIRDDEALRLSYANPPEVLRSSENAAGGIATFKPEALFLIVCINRFKFLRDKEKLELGFFTKITPDTVFCFGGYEVLKYNDCGGVLNSALVAVAFKEADEVGVIEPEVMAEEPHIHRDGAIPIYQRLLTFIEASTKDLEDALEDAKQANRSKSAFLSNMSHEIRTPINAVLGMDEMILRESTEKDILTYAENIRSAGNNLLGIVNDILDFSKIEAGKLVIVPVEYEISSVLNDLVNMVRKRADDKGLEFIVRMDPTIPNILFGDEIRIKQVVTNILTNAVKYTENGSITLDVKTKSVKGGSITLRVAVSDTGIGIKEEDLPKLFDAFERIDERRNRTIEGAGLGMNITQNLLNMMGSKLEVSSVYGEGSTFSFDLEQKIVDDTPIGSFEEALMRSISGRKKYHESFVAPDAHILVVDDTRINLTVIEGLLKRTLLNIDTATSGAECIEMVRDKKYDLIFLDHRMPEMDGIETLNRMLKANLINRKETSVIALTANAVSGSRELYLNAGFDDYISKPVDPMILESVILSYLLPKGLATVTEENVPEEPAISDDDNNNWIDNIRDIDVKKGIANCGSAAALEDAIRVYNESADENLEKIQHFYDIGDIQNLTTRVHALKSSSRIIGALSIGDMAEVLENAGNNGDQEIIKERLPELLTGYKKLVECIRKADPGPGKKNLDEKIIISTKKLKEAYDAMSEIAQMFDYDSLMVVMKSLEEYAIPEDRRDKFLKLKEAVRRADWDEIKKILSKKS